MGETADQIRDQVDAAREGATDKIIQLEQHVTDAAQQVKENLDWRHQVTERPMMAIGVALAGGALFGSITKGGGNGGNSNSRSYEGLANHASSSSSGDGGLAGIIRKAAQSAGLEEKIESAAHSFFASLTKRVGEVATEAFSTNSSASSASPSSSSYAQPTTPTGRVNATLP